MQAWSFLPPAQSFAWDGAGFPFALLTPQSPAAQWDGGADSSPRRLPTFAPGQAESLPWASPAPGTGVCGRPSLGFSCSAKAWGQPAAPRPRELRSAESRSRFWRAASPGAEAAEPGCADRKRKAPAFPTQSEVSQPPAGEDGQHPCKKQGGLLRGRRAPEEREGCFHKTVNTPDLLLLQSSVKPVISEQSSDGERWCYKKQSDFGL